MSDKFAQYTRMDDIWEHINNPSQSSLHENKQRALPLYDPKWKEREIESKKPENKYRHSWYGTPYENPQEQNELEQWINKQRPSLPEREPIDFNYPQLHPEQIGVRQMNAPERARLQNEMAGVYEQMVENRTRKTDRWNSFSDYYRTPDNMEHKEKGYKEDLDRLNKYRKLDQTLPEDIKKEILNNYEIFRKTAAKFYEVYTEANDIASDTAEMSYEGKYKDLIREFARFTIHAITIKIAELLGNTSKGDRYGNHNARTVLKFMKNGVNIFSIHAFNYETKIHELRSITHHMNVIMREYDRLKKVLEKLPKRVNDAVNSFLRQKGNRELLTWLDQYYPDNKEEFVKESVEYMMSDSGTQGRERLQLGDLKNFKVFKSIHDKAIGSSTENLLGNIHKNVSTEVAQELYKHVVDKITPKLTFLKMMLEPGSEDGFPEIARYLKKEYQIDLPSIFNFVRTTIDNHWEVRCEREEKDLTKIEQEGELGRAEKEARAAKNLFFSQFLENLKDNIDTDLNSRNFRGSKYDEHIIWNFLKKFNNTIYMHNLRELPNKTEQDINGIISNIMKDIVVSSLPNFTGGGHRVDMTSIPDFRALGKIIKETGRFSISDFTNVAFKNAPIVPKEFWFNLIKQMVKGTTTKLVASSLEGFTWISNLAGTNQKTGLQALVDTLKKNGKFTTDNFANVFKRYIETFSRVADSIKTEFKGLTETEQANIIVNAIRNSDTIEQDISNLSAFLSFKHNEASDIDQKTMRKIMQNQNFISFTKNGIARKLIKIYASIASRGGPDAIYKKYGNIIPDLIKRKFVSRHFRSNMKFVFSFFNSNAEINPKSEMFTKLFETISSLETDFATIEMGDTLGDLVKHYEEKDKNLYALNLQINDRLRFRVLEGKDPRALRVGVETNCCQRIGGQAEAFARDSFINKLAGILLLEWKDAEGKWVLVSQSYFHYVPKDNGYILDNVEKNGTNERASGVDLEAAYAYLAKTVKEKTGDKLPVGPLGYFLAGKNYSKIEDGDFKSHRMNGGDPRSYSRGATQGTDRRSAYSDFDARNSINLLEPKKMDLRMSTLLPENNATKVAAMNLRRIILQTALVA